MATELARNLSSSRAIAAEPSASITYRYDAFVSYSHDVRQKGITSGLQQAIEQFAKPFWRRRALTLFRDEINLSANPDLWGTIERALGQSRRLILIASPEAATSKWVGREVAWWLDHRGAGSILIVLVSGRLSWVGDRFAAAGTDAIPGALLDAFPQEPLWVDLTGLDPSAQGDGWRRDDRFVGAVAGLAASLRGVSKDEIYGEDLRRHRQTRRSIIAALSLIATFALAATGAAFFANSQRLLALERELTARVQLLAAQARRFDSAPRTAPQLERAGALSLESVNLAREGERALEVDAVETAQDVTARLPLAALRHGQEAITALVQLADGQLASAGQDRRLVVWNAPDTGSPRDLAGDGRISSLMSLSDGRVVSGGDRVQIWSPQMTDPVPWPELQHADKLVVLPDGRVAGAVGNSVLVAPAEAGRSPLELDHGAWIMSLAALPDGSIASGGNDGRIRIWPADGVGDPKVLDNGGTVPALAVLPDGRLVSATDGFGLVKVWPAGGGPPITFTHGDVVYCLAVLPDGRIASGGDDGRIRLWSLDGGEPTVIENGPPPTVLLVLRDGRIASGGFDGLIRIWPADGRGEPVVLRHGSEVYGLAALPDGGLASVGEGETVAFWPAGLAGATTRVAHGAGTMAVAVLPDGRIATGGFDHKIRFWTRAGAPAGPVLEQGSDVRSLAVAPDGRLLSGGFDGTVKLWPAGLEGDVTSLDNGSHVNATAFLKDGRPVSAGEDGIVRVWPADGRGAPIELSHGGEVWAVAELPDGRLASGGADGRVKIWTFGSGSPPLELDHGDTVRALALLADGRLASGGFDGRIRIWPADNSAEPVTLLHGTPVDALAVLPDGRLASGGEDGTIRLWLVEPDAIVTALCSRAGRELSDAEWVRYMGTAARRPACRGRPSNWRAG